MIHHGDCVEVMAGMDPESVDAIVTDPEADRLRNICAQCGGFEFTDKRHADVGCPSPGDLW
jgi:DNA modification methylase